MGFDIGSLSPALIREILEDKKTALADLMLFQSFCDVRDVAEQDGSVYIWDEPVGMHINGQRTSEVSPDADTPQGNASTGTRSYSCPDYRYAQKLNRMAEKSLSTLDDAVEKLVMKSAKKVLGDYNLKIADVLKTNGASGTSDDVTEKAVSNPWTNTSTGTPTVDIDDVILTLGPGLDCIMSANIATILSRHPDVTGSAAGSGNASVGYEAVRQYLRDRGIGEIFILGAQMQNAEGNYARNYAFLYQDVFALSVPGNLVAPRFLALEETVEEDRLNKRKFFVAEHSHDIITGYAAHTYGFTGLTS